MDQFFTLNNTTGNWKNNVMLNGNNNFMHNLWIYGRISMYILYFYILSSIYIKRVSKPKYHYQSFT